MDLSPYLFYTENCLKSYCDNFFATDSKVSTAARYSLLNGGKRTRAILIYLTAEMCKQNWKDYSVLACAVEMIHCYSLIHDDLPCMDNSDLRRGKLSCHKMYGEAIAMLAGDALIGCGLEIVANDGKLSDSEKVKAIKYITNSMGPKGMILGQEMDLMFENKNIDERLLSSLHRHKTGMMISLCGKLGCLRNNLSEDEELAVKTFFDNTGLVFQIVDDILDVEGSAAQLGKPAGSDSNNGKNTFVSIYGLEKSKEIAENLTAGGETALRSAFGRDANKLIEYCQMLLHRNK
jgi:geranylgeranyl diphosphate synthase type II